MDKNIEKIEISTGFIKLDSLLKLSGFASTGGEAKLLIGEGRISVNGELCLMRGKKLYAGDRVKFGGREIEVALSENTQA